MHVTTTRSKNAESFYITQSYINDKGQSTTRHWKKLGTLAELMVQLGTDRAGVMAWAKEQARIETERNSGKTVRLTMHTDRKLDHHRQCFYTGGYLFLQSIYYSLQLDKICHKIKGRHSFEYDLNDILSDLIFARILEPSSKRSSFKAAQQFLEPPSYELHDIYRALSVLAEEGDFIQSEVYKNSRFLGKRNDTVLYYDCTNYYFEIEQEDGEKKYGKSKEHRPNPIVQMGMFTDGDGIPLAFSIFPGNSNEQTSLKPLERKVLQDFEHSKFIYCSDAGLASEAIRAYNSTRERAFIVTQSLKKLGKEDREWALDRHGFRRLADDKPVDLENLTEEDKNDLFYKEGPYITKRLDQRIIVTYSPKYAAYQKELRDKQVERAEKMLAEGNHKKQRKNPNDPGRFIGKQAATMDGSKAEILYYIDVDKINEEAMYDGLYAVCTDLLDDPPAEILKVSERRWQIEACFRILKSDFKARPVYVRREDRIKAHFLICFLALLVYRLLERSLGLQYTCSNILETLRSMNFAKLGDQGWMPLYSREPITDDLHKACGFYTDFEFITKSQMRTIEKQSKGR